MASNSLRLSGVLIILEDRFSAFSILSLIISSSSIFRKRRVTRRRKRGERGKEGKRGGRENKGERSNLEKGNKSFQIRNLLQGVQ